MTDILVIQHEDTVGLGRLGLWLEAAGAHLRICRPDRGDQVPPRAGGADGLIVLGGTAAPHDDDRWPWLPDVRALQRTAVDARLPTLNICLGAQLCAAAYGVDVFRRTAPQLGVAELTLRPEAQEDRLFRGLPEHPQAVLWHQEEIAQLPAGAVHLIEGTDAPVQAFRMGHCAWSVQFHPEPDEETLAAWALGPGSLAAGRGPEEILASFARRAGDIEAYFQPVAERFVEVCRAEAAAP
ncbi:type 1 glutamine amidotransferase [Nesterenkonia pannonica]|uniref:type 1 glutamine amidotransferase n=1 Tax=Nesterenkonia pannonica TaxID=1548602 RepID=UPI0021641210|nr:type 1 glutamine amidotransferase [Nesterenkonia pannonica]